MLKSTEDPFVVVWRTDDPVRADILKDLLEQEGIPVIVPGSMHRGMLGAVGGLVELSIQVPRSRTAAARDLISSLDRYDAVLPDGDDGPEVPREEMERRLDRDSEETHGAGPYRASGVSVKARRDLRLKRVAVFCSLIIGFGTGHIYARAYRPGFLLLGIQALCVALACSGDIRGVLFVPVVLLADLLGSLRAVDRFNGTETLGPLAKMAALAPLVAVVAVSYLGALTVWRAVDPTGYSQKAVAEYCERRSGCNPPRNEAVCVTQLAQQIAEKTVEPLALEQCLHCIRDRSCAALSHDCFCPLSP
ncbi:MAG: DUF2007 domain-containing protein [Myxococcota bacterium]